MRAVFFVGSVAVSHGDLCPLYPFRGQAHKPAGAGCTRDARHPVRELDCPKEELTPKYHRQWTLGQIINPLIDAGLRLERFEEHPDPYWEQFPNMPEEMSRRVPQTYSLLMRKD